ncbi:MAG TPA: cytochrome c oxidase subunit II [Actinomycetota bacterium]|nr:cytochrome c oxidase subunit II [Actinomycetota bacterium]
MRSHSSLPRSFRVPRAALTAVIVLGLTACTPDPATSRGAKVERLYQVFGWIAAVVFAVVVGLIGWSIVRYRAKDDELPEQFRGNVKLEIVWFAIPQIIVIVLFALSMVTQSEVVDEFEDPDVTIESVAFRWGWRFTYANEDVSVVGTSEDPPEIVVPVDRELAFDLEARDVIHNFYVPRFLIKRDMIPGRTNRLDFSIDEPGIYEGLCAEFCGLLHSEMTFTIRAVPEDDYQSWLSEQKAAS